jgi:hypothetical protein
MVFLFCNKSNIISRKKRPDPNDLCVNYSNDEVPPGGVSNQDHTKPVQLSGGV